jgi:hypothetical protein
MHRGHMRWLAVAGLVVPAAWACSLLAQGEPPGGQAPRRVFVAGGGSGIGKLVTGWKSEDLSWVLKGPSGTVAQGVLKSDRQGAIGPRFEAPDVRVAGRLALVAGPQDQPGAALGWEVIVLPKDPLGEARRKLQALGIGRLPAGPWEAELKRSGLEMTELQHDLARSEFKGKVVLLGGLLGDSADATREWLASLPPQTCIVTVLGEEQAAKALLPVLPYLKADAAPKRADLRTDLRSRAWTDLPVEWLGERLPSILLAQPRGVLSVRVLAGYMDEGGAVYPLALESVDAKGHRWLIWNPSWQAADDDPRWGLLLRNSLLWAADALAVSPSAQTRPE